MANGHGGYRRPAHPAPASGPGALSRRTDGRQPKMTLSDAAYGEQAAYQQAESAAPMAQSPAPGVGQVQPFQPVDTSGLTPMGAPSARPDEPITSGLSGGPGAGPALPQPGKMDPQTADKMKSYLPVLIALASQPDVDPATRAYVANLRAEITQ